MIGLPGRMVYPSPYRELAERGPLPVQRFRYGRGRNRYADLRLPPGPADAPPPVAVLVHGGFWKRVWMADLMNALAVWLAERGVATWNVEYRRVGTGGGGWPGTLDDAVAAVEALGDAAASAGVDAGRAVIVGHSAGGHLALHAARAATLRLRGAVALAAVSDLERAAEWHLGDDAAQALLGGEPGEVRERYLEASPAATLPVGVPLLLVHGTRDQAVPPAMSTMFAKEAGAAGDAVEVVMLPGTGHAALVDPASPVWEETILPWVRERQMVHA